MGAAAVVAGEGASPRTALPAPCDTPWNVGASQGAALHWMELCVLECMRDECVFVCVCVCVRVWVGG